VYHTDLDGGPDAKYRRGLLTGIDNRLNRIDVDSIAGFRSDEDAFDLNPFPDVPGGVEVLGIGEPERQFAGSTPSGRGDFFLDFPE
jgi:hypothetical protein